MKKILFCIDSLKPGGAEIIMCNTVNELVKDSNLDITVQLLQKEQKLDLDEKVKVNTFMNNNIFYRRIIKWMPASILHKLIIKEKYDYEIAFIDRTNIIELFSTHDFDYNERFGNYSYNNKCARIQNMEKEGQLYQLKLKKIRKEMENE